MGIGKNPYNLRVCAANPCPIKFDMTDPVPYNLTGTSYRELLSPQNTPPMGHMTRRAQSH